MANVIIIIDMTWGIHKTNELFGSTEERLDL